MYKYLYREKILVTQGLFNLAANGITRTDGWKQTFKLEISTVRLIKHWNDLRKEVVASP